ncbi:MAG: hypothetical protein JEZ07_05430 [Phycisphaerae bacterium]|nr:hypothetical protein [Phycisphaerae bacterium]
MNNRNFYIVAAILIFVSLTVAQNDSDPKKTVLDSENIPDIVDTQKLAELEKAEKYWIIKHADNVNSQTFIKAGYPYYDGGSNYALKAVSQQVQTAINSVDQTKIDSLDDPEKVRFAMERYAELVHQWRMINELPGTTTEIQRTIELTKADTNIYTINSEAAINAKRSLGKLNLANRKFDLTSRLVVAQIINRSDYRGTLSKMEKQIADIKNKLALLATFNDDIGVAMGIGKFDRK